MGRSAPEEAEPACLRFADAAAAAAAAVLRDDEASISSILSTRGPVVRITVLEGGNGSESDGGRAGVCGWLLDCASVRVRERVKLVEKKKRKEGKKAQCSMCKKIFVCRSKMQSNNNLNNEGSRCSWRKEESLRG